MTTTYQHGERGDRASHAVAGYVTSHSTSYPAAPSLQRKSPDDEEIQLKSVTQLATPKEEDLQMKSAVPLKNNAAGDISQRKDNAALQGTNHTGMPDHLKTGIENLSGFPMDYVKVHYNSSQPAQLNALAYAQGTDIHIAPGEERYLPHEAWHVVQQKQGRVRPTMQTKGGVNVNDDKGLEKEADVMGDQAVQQRMISPIIKGTSFQSMTSSEPIQRVSKIYVGEDEINKDEGQGATIFSYINKLTNNFLGEVWFNSGEELQNWIRSIGKFEGIGPWENRWMNFTGKGPIVFGEQHNEIRMDFINALNIKHFVVEGAFERSLVGVADNDIPKHPDSAHQKYTGDANGKALENFWVRSAQGMARFWIEFENDLKNVNSDEEYPYIHQIERLGELEELIRTVRQVRASTDHKTETEQFINNNILNAQFYLEKAYDVGLEDIIEVMKKDGRTYKYNLPKTLKKINVRGKGLHYLYVCFFEFRKAIEEIGYMQFKADASEEELLADQSTKDSSDPFEVWGIRREHFMLKNLEEALSQTPPPLITTLGVAHAKNQQDKLNALLSKYNGKLIMGSIVDLADFGALKGKSTSHPIKNAAVTVVQKKSPDEEDMQMKSAGPLNNIAANGISQRKENSPSPRINHTGMPDQLKSGIENLSGFLMDDVKVHYNSSQPVQLNALAYAQGTDIHIAPGQERHLPHEAWHVVQQKQGRVRPTMQMKGGVNVNDDTGLEHEADVMGGKAIQTKVDSGNDFESKSKALNGDRGIVQAKKTGPFNVDRKYAAKVVDYSEYKDLDQQQYNVLIFDKLKAIYEANLAKGQRYWDNLNNAVESFNAEDNSKFLEEQTGKHAEYDLKFKKNYSSKVKKPKDSVDIDVSSTGLASKKDKVDKSKDPPYSNKFNFEDNSITAKHNYAESDKAREQDVEKKGNEGYIPRGLPNSEILWQQYKLAARSQFARQKDTKAKELMKMLSAIKRRQVQNIATQMTGLFALPDDKTDLKTAYAWQAESEEFLAMLGTPNCSGAAFLLADHVDDLNGKSITEIELLGGDDVNLDIKIG